MITWKEPDPLRVENFLISDVTLGDTAMEGEWKIFDGVNLLKYGGEKDIRDCPSFDLKAFYQQYPRFGITPSVESPNRTEYALLVFMTPDNLFDILQAVARAVDYKSAPAPKFLVVARRCSMAVCKQAAEMIHDGFIKHSKGRKGKATPETLAEINKALQAVKDFIKEKEQV